MKILVMGLPGSGKTYLSEILAPLLQADCYNADKVRERVEIANQIIADGKDLRDIDNYYLEIAFLKAE